MAPPNTNESNVELKPVVTVYSTKLNLPPPGPVDMDPNKRVKSWKRFKQMFKVYSEACGLKDDSPKVQAYTFMSLIGPDAVDVLETFGLTDAQLSDVSALEEKLDEFFIGKSRVFFERYLFNSRSQGPDELFNDFYKDLKELAKTCEFSTLEDTLIRDRIIVAARDERVRNRILSSTKDLTLDEVVDLNRGAEKGREQASAIAEAKTNAEVHALGVSQQQKQSANNEYKLGHVKEPDEDEDKCERCLQLHANLPCPAFNRRCHECHHFGHYAVACLNRRQADDVVESDGSFYEDDEIFFSDSVMIEALDVDETDTVNDWKEANEHRKLGSRWKKGEVVKKSETTRSYWAHT